MQTVLEAKQLLRARFDEGAPCPCCNQLVKRYKRKLNSSMAYVLLLIRKFFAENPAAPGLHVPSYINSLGLRPQVAAAVRGDWAKLQYWDMIRPAGARRADGSPRTGHWNITATGVAFAHGEVVAPQYVYVYNGESWPVRDAKGVTIRECLKDKFNYEELMRG